MGKHAVEKEATGYPIKKIVVGFLVVLLATASLCMAGGFVYLKYLEGRLHKGEKGLEKVISDPIGDEPINFLLLGSDARGKERARTDTIILLHLDVEKKKAVLLSMPRDMRVKIPERGYNKVNAAHVYGGPELMVRTVEDFTGFSIHHYVETDFKGFKKMVDALGGVDIYIDKPMKDRMAGAYFSRGYYTLNGTQALAYVRSRHTPAGDFDRVKRQQGFLRALYKKAKAPVSLTKLPQLVNFFAENTTTDLSTTELLSLASLIRSIQEEDIETFTLPGTPKMIKGISYVIPDEPKIQAILARVKQGKSPSEPVLGYAEKVSPGNVKVEVLNGCGQTGVAQKAKSKLAAQGFKIVSVGDADSWKYQKTKILYRDGQDAKAQCVKKYLPDSQLVVSRKIGESADIRVILGKDYLSN